MNWMGFAFWCCDESGEHLYFVISKPDVDNNILVVNMTTYEDNGRADCSCVLDVGDHPRINRKSYIIYKRAIDVNITSIMTNIALKYAKIAENLTSETLIKIQEGAKNSKFLPNKFKKYFQYFN